MRLLPAQFPFLIAKGDCAVATPRCNRLWRGAWGDWSPHTKKKKNLSNLPAEFVAFEVALDIDDGDAS